MTAAIGLLGIAFNWGAALSLLGVYVVGLAALVVLISVCMKIEEKTGSFAAAVAVVVVVAIIGLCILVGFAYASVDIQVSIVAPPSPVTDSTTTVRLGWTATGDDSLLGRASAYHLSVNDTVYVLDQLPGPSGSGEALDWIISGPATFKLWALDERGNMSPPSNEVSVLPTSGEGDHYLGQFHDAYSGNILIKTLWSGPNGFADGPLIPAAPGTPQSAWVVFTEAIPQAGALYVSRVAPDGTVGEPVYIGSFATFIDADSLLAMADSVTMETKHAKLVSHLYVRWIEPRLYPERTWYWTGVMYLGHHMRRARVWTQRQVQEFYRCPMCRRRGYWCDGVQVRSDCGGCE